MSMHSGSSPTAPTFVVRNTVGREKEISQGNLNGPVSDAALREYCDKHYNQLLPILAEKMHQEKVQQEKLKAVKARLNFEEVSQHSESGTPSRRRDLRKRIRSKRICSVSGSPKPRRGRSESPRKRDPERKTVFKRLEKGVFHRLGDKEKSMSAYSNDSRHQSTKALSESEDSKGGHWKSRSKKQGSSIEDDDLSQPWAAAKVERWAMPTWCHMFNSTLTGSARVWFDDLPPESVDSYDDLKEAFLANFLQQKKCIKDLVEIHHIKQREEESTEDFGEVAAGNQERKKSLPPWKQQEAGHKQNFKKGGFTNQQRSKRRQDRFTLSQNLQKIFWLWKKENIKNYSKFFPDPEISFPPLEEEEGTEGPMIIEAKIRGHFIHRMYVDGGSASEILYEHCFNRLCPEIKNQMDPATAPLIRFSGEIIWPLGQISLLVKIGYEEHSTSAWMNFVIVRSSSTYNGIIRIPGVKKIQAVLSTAHEMLKFPVAGGILTLKSNMTGVPRHIAEYWLNVREGCPPIRQKKRSQAPDRNQAIQEEVEKLIDADIMKEVHYHSWLSNPVMIKKHDGSWRMCVDFKDLNKASPLMDGLFRYKKINRLESRIPLQISF
ncbi:reverse transcriptase domain-containing protein [Tanacetum coccineum]